MVYWIKIDEGSLLMFSIYMVCRIVSYCLKIWIFFAVHVMGLSRQMASCFRWIISLLVVAGSCSDSYT